LGARTSRHVQNLLAQAVLKGEVKHGETVGLDDERDET
jgi:hypothetical protein